MYNIEWDAIEKHFSFSSPIAITIEDVSIESINLTKLNEEFISYIITKAMRLMKAYNRDLIELEELVSYITSMIDEYSNNIYCNERGQEFCNKLTGYCSLFLVSSEAEIDLRDEIYKNFFRNFSLEVF